MKSGITCKQAVDYISKKEEGLLSPTMRFRLWKHLAICSLCRMFSTQNKTMIKAFSNEDHEAKGFTSEEKELMAKTVLEA